MWQKYLEHGIGIFEEHELLEMLLFLLIPRVNTNETAHRLIERFGSLGGVLNAKFGELRNIAGIGVNSAVELCFIGDVAGYISRKNRETITLDSSSVIIDFCIERYKSIPYECFSFYLLDEKLSLIYKEDIEIKQPNEANIDYGNIIKQVVKFESRAVILSHNHPDGGAYASNIDVTSTRILASLLKAINVKIIDHIVIHGNAGYSMRKSGDAAGIWY
ncbi:MAG: hypothetical protein K2J80_09180 [Oscillospiraceae bacterium]|nr:hypothetical protein [Oscillospiraceae bacterium]